MSSHQTASSGLDLEHMHSRHTIGFLPEAEGLRAHGDGSGQFCLPSDCGTCTFKTCHTASKALLEFTCQDLPALRDPAPIRNNKGMLNAKRKLETIDVARYLLAALKDAKMSQADLARELGETAQSVNSWVKTGRIAKGKLLAVSIAVGKPLGYFHGEGEQVKQTTTISDLSNRYGLSEEEIHAALVVVSTNKPPKRRPKKGATQK